MNDSNPYASPTAHGSSVHEKSSGEFVRGAKKGPAPYIALSAITFPVVLAFILRRLLVQFEPVGFALPVIGCIAGAIIFRYRSREWPVDPTAKKRIVKYSIISTLTPPALMFVITGGGRSQGAAMVAICLLVGMSVAVGIILSGTRRHGEFR